MASLFRPKFATYVINEKVTIDTTDREDHSFCGITFPVQCKSVLPVDHIVINSIAVRGCLGPLTVWVTKPNDEDEADDDVPMDSVAHGARANRDGDRRSVHYNLRDRTYGAASSVKRGKMIMMPRYWDKIYEKTHEPSRDYCSLDLGANPIILKQGEIRGIYIHSTLESDQAIVYDNQQKLKTHDDQFLTVLPGRAHVSPEVFGRSPIWGWGNAWRDNREFVGKISYGVVYKLWNPSENLSFGGHFRDTAKMLFLCQRRWESCFSMLSDDCIFYILNMCRWDWMADDFKGLRAHKKKMRSLESDRNHTDNNTDENNTGEDNGESEENQEMSENEEDETNETNHEIAEDGSPPIEIVMEDDDEVYDSDYIGSGEEDSESDDGYDDHRGSSTFQYFYYDDYGSSDEEREAEAQRHTQERRRLMWLREHFGHHFRVQFLSGQDSEDSSS
jgi:hypothetical protein